MTPPRTLLALVIGAFGGAFVHSFLSRVIYTLVYTGVPTGWLTALVMPAAIGGVGLAAAMVLVFPVLMVVPRLRTPSYVVAVMWGAAVAAVTMLFLFRPTVASPVDILGIDWVQLGRIALIGALCGVVYSAAAARLDDDRVAANINRGLLDL